MRKMYNIQLTEAEISLLETILHRVENHEIWPWNSEETRPIIYSIQGKLFASDLQAPMDEGACELIKKGMSVEGARTLVNGANVSGLEIDSVEPVGGSLAAAYPGAKIFKFRVKERKDKFLDEERI